MSLTNGENQNIYFPNNLKMVIDKLYLYQLILAVIKPDPQQLPTF